MSQSQYKTLKCHNVTIKCYNITILTYTYRNVQRLRWTCNGNFNFMYFNGLKMTDQWSLQVAVLSSDKNVTKSWVDGG